MREKDDKKEGKEKIKNERGIIAIYKTICEEINTTSTDLEVFPMLWWQAIKKQIGE